MLVAIHLCGHNGFMVILNSRLPLTLTLSALGIVGYAAWIVPELSCFKSSLTAGLGIVSCLSLFAIQKKKRTVRVFLVLFLLVSMLGVIVASLSKLDLQSVLGIEPYPDTRYAGVLAFLMVGTIIGIWRKSMIARWLSMALGIAGIVSAGLNVAPWISFPSNFTWTLLLHIAGALLLLANLWGTSMRSIYEQDANPTWTSNNKMIASLRWTIFSQMAAIPMLLIYAWEQPIIPETANWALGLAVALSLSIVLVFCQKVIGAIGLILGGLALLILTASTLYQASAISPESLQTAFYYAVFWLPTGLLAVMSGVRLAKPVLRLLRTSV